jgi:hypothetical protein
MSGILYFFQDFALDVSDTTQRSIKYAMFADSELEVTSRLHFIPFYASLKNVRKCTLIVVVHFVLRCYKYFFPATRSAVHTAQAEKQLKSHPGYSACPMWTALRVAGKNT